MLSGLLDEGLDVQLAVRAPYAALAPYLDRRLSVVKLDIDPYRIADDTATRLEALRERLLAEKPDLLVSAAYTRSFSEEWLLRRLEGVRTVAFASTLAGPARETLGKLVPEAELEAPARATIEVHAPEESHELLKNAALGAAILGRALPEREPVLTLPDAERSDAAALLATLGLQPRRYVLGCPAGTANNLLKAWPVQGFADQVEHLQRRHGLPVLLTGLPSEAAHLKAVLEAAAARGVTAHLHVGDPDRLGQLLGLVALSRCYLGTDTGTMHFAGALDVPVLAVFGGGHWPRFLPRARRSFVATQDLPCFGCGWVCWLAEPACITAVDAETVREGLDWILGEAPDERRVHRGSALEPAADRVIRSALVSHRAHEKAFREALWQLHRDGAERLAAMERLGRQLVELDAARQSDVAKLMDDIRRLQEDNEARLQNTIKLDAMAAERLRLIEAQQAILSGRAVKLLRRLRLA